MASLPLYGRSILSLPSHYRNLSSYLTSANPADPQSQLAYSSFIFLNHYKAYQYHFQIIFKLYFERYQVELEDTSSISGAGAMVGNLERLIIGIFLILGQYAAIALVFTAKSIARYDMISKNQGFAEYYLIGSLFSMISVLVTYALLIF